MCWAFAQTNDLGIWFSSRCRTKQQSELRFTLAVSFCPVLLTQVVAKPFNGCGDPFSFSGLSLNISFFLCPLFVWEDLSNSQQHYFQFLSAFQGCLTLRPSSFEPFLMWKKSLKNSEALFPFSIMLCCLSFSFFSSFDLCNENGQASKLRIPAVFPFRSRFRF